MENQTINTEFFLYGLSDLPSLQLPLFLFFLLIYLLTLTWNLLIIILIATHTHLRTPMYFFLGNLACMDLCYSSVVVPRLLFDFHTMRKSISTAACKTQTFFFLVLSTSEVYLLAVMSWDRYVAICRPLHYMHIMSWKYCIQLALMVWSLGFSYSIVQTLSALRLTFCGAKILESFFCDLPQLLKISCRDIFINTLSFIFLADVLGIISLMLTLLPYVYIVKTVLNMQVKGNRSKVFSTCSSHLTVVFMFYGTATSNYLHPNSSNHFNKVFSVFYTVFTSLFNPVIYSLRNQNFIKAFKEVFLLNVFQCI